MKKLWIILLFGCGLCLVGCLSGKTNYDYSYSSPYQYNPYRFTHDEPSWGEVCHLRWPGEFTERAKEYCRGDFVSAGIDFDRQLYPTTIDVRDTTQLAAALEHPSAYKYLNIQTDIVIDREYTVLGNLAIHGNGKLIFRAGGLRLGQPASSGDPKCNVGRIRQSVRIIVATENPVIASAERVHLVFQAPVKGKIHYPESSFLALGFYSFEVESTERKYNTSVLAYGAKVGSSGADYGSFNFLGTSSQIDIFTRSGTPLTACLDTESQRRSQNFWSNGAMENVCRNWAETAYNWNACGVAQ